MPPQANFWPQPSLCAAPTATDAQRKPRQGVARFRSEAAQGYPLTAVGQLLQHRQLDLAPHVATCVDDAPLRQDELEL
jgi:hypothetical protein